MKYQVLDHEVKIYIPTTKDIDTVADTTSWQDKAKELFARTFGGFTAYQTNGGWNSEERGIVEENVIIIESKATAEQVANDFDKIIEFAEQLKTGLGQEAVSVERDNEMILVGVQA